MTRPPRRSVLHKIAARRNRVEGAATPAAWTTFLTGSAPAAVTQQRRPAVVRSRLLTQRELEVLHLVAHGETDQRIADRLYVSRRTISCHVSNILTKLQVPSRTAAAVTAARIGLL
jgi:DNA-binding NarL/FixJ family response regulator